MKLKHGLLTIGLLTTGWLAIFGDKTPAGAVVLQTQRTPNILPSINGTKSIDTHLAQASSSSAPIILSLKDRKDLMGMMSNASQGALFDQQTWVPPPPPPPPPSPMDLKPTAPPLPFVYLGKQIQDGIWQVFLADGQNTYVVKGGEVISGDYRVEKVEPPLLTLSYLPLNQQQTLTIE